VERVIGRFVPESDLTAQNLFLTAFQDIVTEYCDRGQGDVHSFLSWWDETGHSRKIDTPPDRDSLIVTTVHKSKGLQYPCVHLPFANWELTEYSSATKLIFEWFDMAPVKRLGLAADGLIPPVMPIKLEKAIADSPLSDQLQAIFKKQKIDNINLLYVAMTRAENELIVSTNAYTPSTKGDDGALKAEKLTRILNLAISSGAGQIAGLDTYGDISDYTLPLEQAYDSAAATLTVGRPTKPDTLREDEDEAQQMPPYFTSDSQNIWDDTCIDDAIDPYRSRDRGILLHDVLSRVRHAGDLDLALRRRAYRLGLTAAETSMARQALGQALGQPDARRWFEDFARVLNERTITLDDGSRYRPDRVVWTTDGTIEVVDYKFGKERAARYARQVNRYAGFLREIYPGTTVKGYVWYPESGHIVATDSATAST